MCTHVYTYVRMYMHALDCTYKLPRTYRAAMCTVKSLLYCLVFSLEIMVVSHRYYATMDEYNYHVMNVIIMLAQ